MAYIYPLNNPGGVHLTVFYFTHLSHPPTLVVSPFTAGTSVVLNIDKQILDLFHPNIFSSFCFPFLPIPRQIMALEENPSAQPGSTIGAQTRLG